MEISGTQKEEFIQAAILAGEYLLKNQNKDSLSANFGRFIQLDDKSKNVIELSTNWTTGTGIIALLMLYQETKEEKYLQSAQWGGEYLKSLQVLDNRHPHILGVLREGTPQTQHSHPRDAVTGASGLLTLFHLTGEDEYLYRVKLFADWYLKHAKDDGWICWDVLLPGGEKIPYQGSFQAGAGIFFYHLQSSNGEDRYLEEGLRYLADGYLTRFLRSGGSLKVLYDNKRKIYDDLDSLGLGELQDWLIMHYYNDDFAALSLLAAYKVFGKDKYLEGAKRFGEFLIARQNDDGSMGNPVVGCASATTVILMKELYDITREEKYLAAAIKSALHLLTLQEKEVVDSRTYGGFYGMAVGIKLTDKRIAINARITHYAIIALLSLAGFKGKSFYSVS